MYSCVAQLIYFYYSTTMNDFKESSTLNRMQEKYWATKQAVFKKLGKKDDDCIIASDAELDAKLELFQTIEESFFALMRILENYQDRLCGLAQEENAMGRFLKENGKHDKTRAGKIMIGAGKALSFSAQQKLSLRLPLVRLYHEVETFQFRAIVDCLQTVESMEKARTAYRGALMWMKDVSQQLDPDTCKQLEKFRKVQSNVRKTKVRFDKLKLDTLQKVDLLSFSRCNLFSQALAAYQSALITICEKVSRTMTSVADTTKGYQHYEFSTLKELTETSKKLAEETTIKNECHVSDEDVIKTDDKDVLLFFEAEYHDHNDITKNSELGMKDCSGIENHQNISSANTQNQKNKKKKFDAKNYVPLLDLHNDSENNDVSKRHPDIKNGFQTSTSEEDSIVSSDLLTGIQNDDSDKSTLELLNEILETNNEFTLPTQWPSSGTPSFDFKDEEMFKSIQNSAQISCFLPSQLLDMSAACTAEINSKDTSGNMQNAIEKDGKSIENLMDGNKKGKQDMSSWYNLFADLDPLANPDLIGKKQVDEINC